MKRPKAEMRSPWGAHTQAKGTSLSQRLFLGTAETVSAKEEDKFSEFLYPFMTFTDRGRDWPISRCLLKPELEPRPSHSGLNLENLNAEKKFLFPFLPQFPLEILIVFST